MPPPGMENPPTAWVEKPSPVQPPPVFPPQKKIHLRKRPRPIMRRLGLYIQKKIQSQNQKERMNLRKEMRFRVLTHPHLPCLSGKTKRLLRTMILLSLTTLGSSW